MLHQVGDLFELNVKLRCQKVNTSHARDNIREWSYQLVFLQGYDVCCSTAEKHFPFFVILLSSKYITLSYVCLVYWETDKRQKRSTILLLRISFS